MKAKLTKREQMFLNFSNGAFRARDWEKARRYSDLYLQEVFKRPEVRAKYEQLIGQR